MKHNYFWILIALLSLIIITAGLSACGKESKKADKKLTSSEAIIENSVTEAGGSEGEAESQNIATASSGNSKVQTQNAVSSSIVKTDTITFDKEEGSDESSGDSSVSEYYSAWR